MQIKVAIVDDDEGIRSSLAALIRRASTLRLAGEYADAESALRDIPTHPPDVVLMDINLPGIKGVECVRQLKTQVPTVQFLMLTVYEDSDSLFNSLKAGASGYLVKDLKSTQLPGMIKDIGAGKSLLDNRGMTALMKKLAARAVRASRPLHRYRRSGGSDFG